jgi:hypothetical protein
VGSVTNQKDLEMQSPSEDKYHFNLNCFISIAH